MIISLPKAGQQIKAAGKSWKLQKFGNHKPAWHSETSWVHVHCLKRNLFKHNWTQKCTVSCKHKKGFLKRILMVKRNLSEDWSSLHRLSRAYGTPWWVTLHIFPLFHNQFPNAGETAALEPKPLFLCSHGRMPAFTQCGQTSLPALHNIHSITSILGDINRNYKAKHRRKLRKE